jgi:sigma-E factor negative regulatory protein RseA
MKNGLYEQLSALVDDELTGSEHAMLLKRIESDEQLYERLSHYQLISDALQNHLPDRVDPVFSRRVRGILRAEPALSRYSRLGALLRPVTGVAVAASVAVMAVMTIQSTRQETTPSTGPVASGPVASSLPPDSGYLRVDDNPGSMGNQAVDLNRKLDIYLVNHNEYAVDRGMQGMLPYVRMVGHEMNRSARQ